jgi:chromosome segregation ATPase
MGSRSSPYHPRPSSGGSAGDPMTNRYAEPNPMFDPVVEQLRFENDQLRQDNQQLKNLMEEMRQLLQDASEQEQRVQTELAEREVKLTAATEKIAELEAIVNAKPKTKTELEEWADELERESFQIAQERRAMEEDRKQLRDDETSLEKQMREMEVQMARERAMLARQEQELKRLNGEIQHELNLMQNGDGALRDRLAMFQRRHAEVVGAPATNGFTASPVVPSANPTPPPKKNDTTGLLRKLFRGGE